jgi:hypothetical protein
VQLRKLGDQRAGVAHGCTTPIVSLSCAPKRQARSTAVTMDGNASCRLEGFSEVATKKS